MNKSCQSMDNLPRQSVYHVPEGFFESEIERVTLIASSKKHDAPIQNTHNGALRRIFLWTTGLSAAVAIAGIILMPLQDGSEQPRTQDVAFSTIETETTFTEEEAKWVRPDMLADNDIFLSIY